MSSHTVIWSAATCNHTGAGVYLGLAPQREHMIVARALSRRQAKLFIGGRVRCPGEPRPWQLYYYAVRDPSAVRVVPVSNGPMPGGFRAAELRFRFAPSLDETVASRSPESALRRDVLKDATPAAFLLTIGLNGGDDRAFFLRTVGEEDHDWAQVFSRVIEDGCNDEAA